MSSIEEIVAKFLDEEEKDPEAKLLLSILRVLSSYYGVLWLSELYGDLIKFYSFFDWPIDFDIKRIDKAVDKLKKMGLMTVELRYKASYTNEVRKEKFVRLVDMRKTIDALANANDDAFSKFRNRF